VTRSLPAPSNRYMPALTYGRKLFRNQLSQLEEFSLAFWVGGFYLLSKDMPSCFRKSLKQKTFQCLSEKTAHAFKFTLFLIRCLTQVRHCVLRYSLFLYIRWYYIFYIHCLPLVRDYSERCGNTLKDKVEGRHGETTNAFEVSENGVCFFNITLTAKFFINTVI